MLWHHRVSQFFSRPPTPCWTASWTRRRVPQKVPFRAGPLKCRPGEAHRWKKQVCGQVMYEVVFFHKNRMYTNVVFEVSISVCRAMKFPRRFAGRIFSRCVSVCQEIQKLCVKQRVHPNAVGRHLGVFCCILHCYQRGSCIASVSFTFFTHGRCWWQPVAPLCRRWGYRRLVKIRAKSSKIWANSPKIQAKMTPNVLWFEKMMPKIKWRRFSWRSSKIRPSCNAQKTANSGKNPLHPQKCACSYTYAAATAERLDRFFKNTVAVLWLNTSSTLRKAKWRLKAQTWCVIGSIFWSILTRRENPDSGLPGQALSKSGWGRPEKHRLQENEKQYFTNEKNMNTKNHSKHLGHVLWRKGPPRALMS